MTIGIVTTWFERGAAYVSRQYMELLEQEHRVLIYARGGESYSKNDANWNLPNVTWGRKAICQINNTPTSRSDLLKWVRSNDIDIVIFNEQHWWPPVIWLKELGVVVGTYVDYYTEETVPLFGVFDFLLCNTKRHLSAFDWHPCAHYLPWGTNVDLFVPGEKEARDLEKVVFFNSSGYSPGRKGVDVLLRAFLRLDAPEAKLLLHTQIDLLKHYADLKNEMRQLQEEGRLEIVRETITAPGIYFRADVYCYLSRLDGIGLTLPEAISCGLQVITPDQPPMNEFVEDGQNGRLIRVEKEYCRNDGYYWPQCQVSEDDLVQKMRNFVDQRTQLPEMKRRARQYALDHLDWATRQGELSRIMTEARAGGVAPGMKKKIKDFELSKSTFKMLVRVPYRMMKNILR